MLFLISYKFTDANAQDKGSKMLKEWYDKGGPQNRPENYDVKSCLNCQYKSRRIKQKISNSFKT